MQQHRQLSQNAIGRALGLSSATMTKCKKMGMPVHSIEAARTWRENNIAPTAHGLLSQRRSANPRHKTLQTFGALRHATTMLNMAAAALAAGQNITAMVPAMRAALRAVPVRERDPTMLLPSEVMDVLTAEVMAALPAKGELNDDGSPAWHSADNPMSEGDADELGEFWYQVAAGEIRLA